MERIRLGRTEGERVYRWVRVTLEERVKEGAQKEDSFRFGVKRERGATYPNSRPSATSITAVTRKVEAMITK